MRVRWELPVLTLGVLLAAGCGPNCQTTCQRLYADGIQDGQEDCGIGRPGRTQGELIDQCNDYCEAALDTPGDLGSFDPYTRAGSNESITLENERQAALWMECVADTTCTRLNEGYCAPVW